MSGFDLLAWLWLLWAKQLAAIPTATNGGGYTRIEQDHPLPTQDVLLIQSAAPRRRTAQRAY